MLNKAIESAKLELSEILKFLYWYGVYELEIMHIKDQVDLEDVKHCDAERTAGRYAKR